MLWLGLDKAGVQCWLHQFDLVWVGTVEGDRQRQASGLHDGHDLACLPFLALPTAVPPRLAGAKEPSLKHSRNSSQPLASRSRARSFSTASNTPDSIQA